MENEPSKGIPGRQPIGVGVWGLGPHARKNILPAIAACDSTQLIGLTTRNIDAARSEAAKYSCRVWATPENMLSSSDVDAVYLSTPIGLHYEQGKEILAANKHLWCDKSLTARSLDTDDLCALARNRRRSICEAFMYLYHPQFLRIKDVVMRQRALGDVSSITCRFGLPPLDNPGFRHSRELGGGALLDVACYPLSLALHLTNEEPRVLARRLQCAPGFEVDTSGFSVLEFPSGLVAYLEWGYQRAYTNEVRVCGTAGSLYADRVFSKSSGLGVNIDFFDAHGMGRTETVEFTNSYVQMLKLFAHAATDDELQTRLRHEAQRQAYHLSALSVL